MLEGAWQKVRISRFKMQVANDCSCGAPKRLSNQHLLFSNYYQSTKLSLR